MTREPVSPWPVLIELGGFIPGRPELRGSWDMTERNSLLQDGTEKARPLLAKTERSRQLKTETVGAWRLGLGRMELSSFRLRSNYSYDAAPGGQTLLQDPEDERARQIQAETEVTRQLQADLEGAR